MTALTMRRLALVAAAFALLFGLAHTTPGAAHVYWTEGQSASGRNDHIGRANLDATMMDRGFISAGVDGVNAVALGPAHVYWTNDHGYVGRADLDGGNANDTWLGSAGTVVKGVAVGAERLYWANWTVGAIGTAKLDGSDRDDSFVPLPGGPQGVASSGSYVYFGQGGGLGRADVTSGSPESFLRLTTDLLGLAADTTHLYWIDQSAIWRANLDGTGVGTLVNTGCGPTAAICGVAIDATHLYWTRYDAGAIGRANLDGTGVEPDFVTGLTHPTGVAVDSGRTPVPPANTAYPQISGTPQVGQTLSCSTGSWSGDPPLTYTYAWLRGGVRIDGATTPTYLLVAADANQTVQCEVTASGPGGSAVHASGGQSVLAAQPLPAPVVPPAPTPAPVSKAPAKIRVLRAGVDSGVLDMLVEITSLAAKPGATLALDYESSGVHTKFSVPIAASASASRSPRARTAETQIKIRKTLPRSQRAKDTGIVTLTYAGSDTVGPDSVRLRAADGKSLLVRKTTKIENGRLIVSGTITRLARGVVRVRLGYDRPDATTAFLYWNARIAYGTWKINQLLPAEAAKGGQLAIQFTGYEPRDLRGEQTAKQVLP